MWDLIQKSWSSALSLKKSWKILTLANMGIMLKKKKSHKSSELEVYQFINLSFTKNKMLRASNTRNQFCFPRFNGNYSYFNCEQPVNLKLLCLLNSLSIRTDTCILFSCFSLIFKDMALISKYHWLVSPILRGSHYFLREKKKNTVNSRLFTSQTLISQNMFGHIPDFLIYISTHFISNLKKNLFPDIWAQLFKALLA